MSIFIIPMHKRFAVRQKVQLRDAGGQALPALMIEISLRGCRVNIFRHQQLAVDQPITIHIDGFGEVDGHIRSAGDGLFGIRFTRPVQTSALHALVRSRKERTSEIAQVPAFGTG